jgi:hypothetical protein
MAHYYSADGTLVAEVDNASKPGEKRPTDLRDARKLGLYPSVTTMMAIMNKPALNDWKVRKALQEFLDQVRVGIQHIGDDRAVISTIIKQSEAYGNWAAEFGTEVHKGMQRGFAGMEHLFQMEGTREVTEGLRDYMQHNGYETQHFERTMVSPQYGCAGTVDWLGLHWGVPAIVDFKTQDFTLGPRGGYVGLNWYDEYPIQLAAYDTMLMVIEGRTERLKRISLVASRTDPGLVVPKEYTEEDRERYDEAWFRLLSLWKLLRRYDIGFGTEKRTIKALEAWQFDPPYDPADEEVA